MEEDDGCRASVTVVSYSDIRAFDNGEMAGTSKRVVRFEIVDGPNSNSGRRSMSSASTLS